MNTTNIQHQTRDHRFAYISAGDIGFWAKATTGPTLPKGKQVPRVFSPVTNLDALREAAAKLTVGPTNHDPKSVVLLVSDDDGGVVGAMKKCDKVVRIANDRMAISNMMNRILQPHLFSQYQRKHLS
jgi:hypothetical protein